MQMPQLDPGFTALQPAERQEILQMEEMVKSKVIAVVYLAKAC